MMSDYYYISTCIKDLINHEVPIEVLQPIVDWNEANSER